MFNEKVSLGDKMGLSYITGIISVLFYESVGINKFMLIWVLGGLFLVGIIAYIEKSKEKEKQK